MYLLLVGLGWPLPYSGALVVQYNFSDSSGERGAAGGPSHAVGRCCVSGSSRRRVTHPIVNRLSASKLLRKPGGNGSERTLWEGRSSNRSPVKPSDCSSDSALVAYSAAESVKRQHARRSCLRLGLSAAFLSAGSTAGRQVAILPRRRGMRFGRRCNDCYLSRETGQDRGARQSDVGCNLLSPN